MAGRPGSLTSEQHRELVLRWEDGESATELAADFGIAKSSVYRYLRGTYPPPRREIRSMRAFVHSAAAKDSISKSRRRLRWSTKSRSGGHNPSD